MRDFFEHKIVLNCPTKAEIAAAHRTLPAVGNIEISCGLRNLQTTLQVFENDGFFGMHIVSKQSLERGVVLRAYKGKNGPCYDSGKVASYSGGALAALDDDRHVLLTENRICEKTARIYSLPVYQKTVQITGGNPELLARLQTNPLRFDCDTFEDDAQKLAAQLADPPAHVVEQVPLLYPGPFKMLILPDGAMLQRGVPTLISRSAAQKLIELDDCILLQGEIARLASVPESFQHIYKEEGAFSLLKSARQKFALDALAVADLSAVDEAPIELRQRLQKMIDSKSEYFIMTGSDARDLDGCCPSDGVKAANRLVEAGVLQVARSASVAGACPVNIYAFAGEIRQQDEQPVFKINERFRTRVYSQLQQNANRRPPKWQSALRWSLLLFVAFYLGVLISNRTTSNRESIPTLSEAALNSALELPFQSGVAVLQFHRNERCSFCNNMEAHARAGLDSLAQQNLPESTPVFQLVNMALPQFQPLVEKFQLFTSSIVFVEVQNGEIVRWRIFAEAWDLTEKQQEFIAKFRAALLAFRDERQ